MELSIDQALECVSFVIELGKTATEEQAAVLVLSPEATKTLKDIYKDLTNETKGDILNE